MPTYFKPVKPNKFFVVHAVRPVPVLMQFNRLANAIRFAKEVNGLVWQKNDIDYMQGVHLHLRGDRKTKPIYNSYTDRRLDYPAR